MRASRPGDGSPPPGPPPGRAGVFSGDGSRRQRGSHSRQRGSYDEQRGSGQHGPGLQHGSCQHREPHSPPVSSPRAATARRPDRSPPPASRRARRGPEQDRHWGSTSFGNRRRSRQLASPIFVRRVTTPPSGQEREMATATGPPAAALGRPPSRSPLSDVVMFPSMDDR